MYVALLAIGLHTPHCPPPLPPPEHDKLTAGEHCLEPEVTQGETTAQVDEAGVMRRDEKEEKEDPDDEEKEHDAEKDDESEDDGREWWFCPK